MAVILISCFMGQVTLSEGELDLELTLTVFRALCPAVQVLIGFVGVLITSVHRALQCVAGVFPDVCVNTHMSKLHVMDQ